MTKRRPSSPPPLQSDAPLGRRDVPVTDLNPADYNPREIGEKQFEALKLSLKSFGMVQEVVANRRADGSLRVVGGHQRLKAAIALGWATVPVVEVALDDAHEKALNVALNARTMQGTFTASLAGLLEGLDVGDELFEGLGFNELELEAQAIADAVDDERFDGAQSGPREMVEDQIPALPATPRARAGDVWLLGRHRVFCGDSTNASNVAQLLNGVRPMIMVTDPPYGVDYDPEWRKDKGISNSERMGQVLNDDRVDWTAAYQLFPGDVCYVWHASKFFNEVAAHIAACEFKIRSQIIWAKSRMTIGRGNYHWQHKPCWYAVKQGATASWTGDCAQTTLWQIDARNQDQDTIHGTQKPLECMARPMRNHGGKRDVVYDPFLGSGTTLIAAEQMGRTCYGLELDPRYVDVIVQRWEALTGKVATVEKEPVSY